MRFPVFLLVSAMALLPACFLRTDAGGVRLNYLEYKRGKSYNNRSDIDIISGAGNWSLSQVQLTDYSYFPDNSIVPNAFLEPLFKLRFHDALKAFTEPYYSFRFIHFLKKNPKIGIGLELIHLKVFLRDYNQVVTVTGESGGQGVQERWRLGDYFDHYNVSHGVNHAALYLEYRELFFPNETIRDGRLQTFANLSLGITVPHLETEFRIPEGSGVYRAYSYQAGARNLGVAAGAGIRYRPFRGIGFNLEYKYTYSFLNGMRFDNGQGSRVRMNFGTSQLQWGIAFIF